MILNNFDKYVLLIDKYAGYNVLVSEDYGVFSSLSTTFHLLSRSGLWFNRDNIGGQVMGSLGPGGCDGYDEIWTGRRTFPAPHLLARTQIEFRAVETHISKRGQRRSFPVLNDVPGGKYI